MDAKSAERGSHKVFGTASHDHEALSHALGFARAEFEIKRWWKFGQPAIDRIEGELQVSSANVGSTVAKLMQLNGPNLEVITECFPFGITNPEFRLQVTLQKNE
jgi:hypothetical protein